MCAGDAEEVDSAVEASLAVHRFRGIWFAREVFPPEVYAAARQVLQISARPPDRADGWVYQRFFERGIPSFTGVSNEITRWAETLRDSTKATSDLVNGAIDSLENKSQEIGDLITRVDSYIEQLEALEIPAGGKILVITGRGTDGVVQGLMGAEDKPQDGPNGYAVGAVMVFGGLPAVVVDALSSLIQKA